MEIIIYVFLWFLIGALSGSAGVYWIDKEDLILKDMVIFSCLGVITLLGAIMYAGAELFKNREICKKLIKFWNKTLIRR
jgi:hypothetical protein